MKRILLAAVALVVAAVLPVPALEAQSIIPFIGGGIAKGVSDLSDGTDLGWAAFAGAGLPIASAPGFSVGAVASWTHIPYSGSAGAATNIPALFGEVGYLIGATTASMVKPYVRAGVGVMQHRYDPGSTTTAYTSDYQTKAGFSAGAGLNFVMESVTPFVGAHFITGGSDTSFFIVYGGVSFGGGGPSKATIRR